MKTMNQLSKDMTCLTMFLCLLVVSGGAERLVLCFGESGHMALEPPHGSLCRSTLPFNSVFSSSKEHRGECLDLPLSITVLDQNIDLFQDHAITGNAPVMVVILPQTKLMVDKPYTKPLTLSSLNTATPIISQHTTILLI